MILNFYKIFLIQETVSFVFLTTYNPYSLMIFIYKSIIFHSICSSYLARSLIFSYPVCYLIS